MNTEAKRKMHFFEGGNLVATIAVPASLILCLVFYGKVASYVKPLGIKIEDVYSYSFNLFALQIGALLALYALFVCRPTPFLERMKNTRVFEAILANTKLTMLMTAAMMVATGALGLLHIGPEDVLAAKSLIFLLWCAGFAVTTFVYVRTTRLVFAALD